MRYWLAKLRDDGFRGLAAITALESFGASVVSHMIENLGSNDPTLRARSAHVLARVGPVARDAVPMLLRVAKDDDVSVREAAIASLGKIGVGGGAVVKILIGALKDESISVAVAAIGSLGQLGPEAKEAVGALAAFVGSGLSLTCIPALDALALMGAEAKGAAPKIRLLLAHKNAAMRDAAARALHRIEGPGSDLPAERAVSGMSEGDSLIDGGTGASEVVRGLRGLRDFGDFGGHNTLLQQGIRNSD